MTPKTQQTKTLVFEDPAEGKQDNTVAVVTVGAAKLVQWSNSIDLRGDDDISIACVTWPSRYKVRVV